MLRRPQSRRTAAALRLARPSLPPLEAYMEELLATWDGGWLSNSGPHAERFERLCAEYTGLRDVRAVANCDIGLTLAGQRHVGSFGDASVFSFSATKIATCGEGGLAAFRDPCHSERFALLRGYGSDAYDSKLVGLNGKLSELHAALGCLNMAMAEDEVDARLRLVRLYTERLSDLPRWSASKRSLRRRCR